MYTLPSCRIRAEVFALALEKIYQVAYTIDSKTMSLQYLDMLKALGASTATKVVVPFEFTILLRPFLDHTSETAVEGLARTDSQGFSWSLQPTGAAGRRGG
jgi:hypothetical protein